MPRLKLVDGAMKLEDVLILNHDRERLRSLDEETALDRAARATTVCDASMSGDCHEETESGAP